MGEQILAQSSRLPNGIVIGELVLGGALANPADQAILLFKGDSPAMAERFAKDDPYVRNGLVKQWRVREWTTVVGPEAQVQVKA